MTGLQRSARIIEGFGPRQTVEDATTQALNDPASGDVGSLWTVGAGTANESFQAIILIEAQVRPFDPNAGSYLGLRVSDVRGVDRRVGAGRRKAH